MGKRNFPGSARALNRRGKKDEKDLAKIAAELGVPYRDGCLPAPAEEGAKEPLSPKPRRLRKWHAAMLKKFFG